MKNLILVLFIGITATLKAQTFVNYSSGGIGVLDSNLNNSKGVQGSTYLFNDWNSTGRVFCNNQQIFDVENLNFDVKNTRFVSKISNDSIFIFDNIFKVNINGRNFVSLKNKFYESLYSSNHNFVFIKEYLLKIEPELHKITNTVIGPGKYKIEDKYYVYKDGEISKLNLNKKQILEILKKYKSEVLKYTKDYHLSFSDEEDVIKIFNFYNNQSR
jgi:hypothetical protein